MANLTKKLTPSSQNRNNNNLHHLAKNKHKQGDRSRSLNWLGISLIVLFSVLSLGIYLIACAIYQTWLLPRSCFNQSSKVIPGSQLSRVVTRNQEDRQGVSLGSHQPDFQLFLTERSRTKVEEMIRVLTSPEYRSQVDESVVESLSGDNRVKEMAKLLYQSKMPKSFAENTRFDDGLLAEEHGSWSKLEFDALEGLYVHTKVETYHSAKPYYPELDFDSPKEIDLWFVPGPVLSAGPMQCDTYQRVAPDGRLNGNLYQEEMVRRILPVMQAVNRSAEGDNDSILFKVPGITCGQFGGVWSEPSNGYLTQRCLRRALEQMLTENSFSNIQGVVFDTYVTRSLGEDVEREGGKYSQDLNGTKFVAITSQQYNVNHQDSPIYQNSQADVYDDSFAGCREVAICAADALSLPGNDMNVGRYLTNEGWWAGCSNLLQKIFGVEIVSNRYGVRIPVIPGNAEHIQSYFLRSNALAPCSHIEDVSVLPTQSPSAVSLPTGPSCL